MTIVYVSVSVQVSEVMIPESLGFQVRHEELVQFVFVFVFVLRSFWLFNSNCFSSNLHFAVIYTHAYRYDACASWHTLSSLCDVVPFYVLCSIIEYVCFSLPYWSTMIDLEKHNFGWVFII